jgi:hypothetical protein
MGMICELDLSMYIYDERARFVERVDLFSKLSKDSSCRLSRESDSPDLQQFSLKVDFKAAKASCTALVLYLEGGPRNFQFLQTVSVTAIRVLPDRGYGEFLPNEFDNNGCVKI